MTSKVKCPKCSHALEVPESAIGGHLRCPVCGQGFRVTQGASQQDAEMQHMPEMEISGPPAGNRFHWASIILSCLALVVATAGMIVAFTRGGKMPEAKQPEVKQASTPEARWQAYLSLLPGTGLASYDLSTPENAVKSRMQMEANCDMRALMEFDSSKDLPAFEVARRDMEHLQCERVIEHEGKVAVLYKTRESGLDRYKVQWLEKKGTSYLPRFVETYLWKNRGGDEARIAKLIDDWLAKEESLEDTKKPPASPQGK